MTGKKKGSHADRLGPPETPLNNNPAELGERVAARRRDVSLHSAKAEGRHAGWTRVTSIVQTAKKLAVNGYEYPSPPDQRSAKNALLGESNSPAVACLPPLFPPLPITHRPASCRPSHCSPVWRVASISQDTVFWPVCVVSRFGRVWRRGWFCLFRVLPVLPVSLPARFSYPVKC